MYLKSIKDIKRRGESMIKKLAPYELSVSTGYVRFDNRFKTAKDFIEAADRLMYETKRSTRKDYSKI